MKQPVINPIRHKKFVILTICFGFLAAFFLSEIILRLLGIGYGNSPQESDPFLHHVHPRNYSFFSHHSSNEYGGFIVRYDNEGLRIGTEKSKTTNSPRYRIAFLGDSFVEGNQVAYEHSFVGLLEAKSKNPAIIKNFGVSGYSPAIYYLQYKKSVSKFYPTHIFLLLYGNDVADDKRYTSIGSFDPEGNLISIPGPEGGNLVKILRKSYVARFIRRTQLRIEYLLDHPQESNTKQVGPYIEQAPEISDLTGNYLLKINKLATNDKANFFLMAVPSKFKAQGLGKDKNYQDFAKTVMIWAKEHNVNYIDLSVDFLSHYKEEKLFFDKDIHFNEEGHKVVAKTLAEYVPDIFH